MQIIPPPGGVTFPLSSPGAMGFQPNGATQDTLLTLFDNKSPSPGTVTISNAGDYVGLEADSAAASGALLDLMGGSAHLRSLSGEVAIEAVTGGGSSGDVFLSSDNLMALASGSAFSVRSPTGGIYLDLSAGGPLPSANNPGVWCELDSTKASGLFLTGFGAGEPSLAGVPFGTFALWLDPTHGATVFHVIARDATGTVVRGQIALA